MKTKNIIKKGLLLISVATFASFRLFLKKKIGLVSQLKTITKQPKVMNH